MKTLRFSLPLAALCAALVLSCDPATQNPAGLDDLTPQFAAKSCEENPNQGKCKDSDPGAEADGYVVMTGGILTTTADAAPVKIERESNNAIKLYSNRQDCGGTQCTLLEQIQPPAENHFTPSATQCWVNQQTDPTTRDLFANALAQPISRIALDFDRTYPASDDPSGTILRLSVENPEVSGEAMRLLLMDEASLNPNNRVDPADGTGPADLDPLNAVETTTDVFSLSGGLWLLSTGGRKGPKMWCRGPDAAAAITMTLNR